MEPTLARNEVNSVCWTQREASGTFPTIAPTRISINATEIPILMLMSEAASAIATHTNATQ